MKLFFVASCGINCVAFFVTELTVTTYLCISEVTLTPLSNKCKEHFPVVSAHTLSNLPVRTLQFWGSNTFNVIPIPRHYKGL